MRQGNGTDLLGNDPRSASVGIIYVSPTDDRKSVLAALITQEKFQRKQVAIVLPPGQNKAFQRPVDFDDLKNVRRKLQTEIVFIAPSGPGPAEFARQRRFHVYSSLESYAKALREDQSLGSNANGEKKGGIFGLGKPKSPVSPPVPAVAPDEKRLSAQPVPVEPAIGQQRGGQQANSAGAAIAGAAAGAAAMGAADAAMHAHDNALQDAPTAQNIQKPTDAQAQAYSNNSGATIPTTPRPAFHPNEDATVLPPSPLIVPLPASPAASQQMPPQNGGNGGGYSAGPNGGQTGGPMGANTGPTIIELSPVSKRGKPTVKLPIAGQTDASAPAVASGTNKVPPRNTDKMAAAGTGVVGGAVLGATMMNRGGGAGTPQRANAGGGGTRTPQQTTPKRSNQPNNRPRRRRGGVVALVAALVLLALLLSCVGFAYLQPTTFASVVRSVNAVVPNLSGTTTVTIVPDSQIVSHSYVISAVTGTPDPNQRQVKAFPLSYTPAAKSVTVPATGRKDIAATPAKGTLSFINGGGAPYTFGTKTPITSSSGIVVFLNAPVTIPAANPIAGTFGKATGTATTSTTGANTNIPAGGINTSASGNAVTVVNNTAFTGGQDAAHYNFVQQSDITNAAQPLQTALTQEAQNNLKKQPATGQALASGSQCTPKVTADHAAGDTGVNVANVTVTVSVTCTAEAYDAAGLQTLAKSLLRQQVDQDPTLGKDYLLQGQVVTDTSIESIKNGTVFLSVSSKGLYVYGGLEAQKSQLANLIKGKAADQAIALLKSQAHIKDASLPGGVTTLPTDPGQIIIVIQMPQGFSGGGTTNGGNPNPAPTTVTGNG